jgi:hypothetical protein
LGKNFVFYQNLFFLYIMKVLKSIFDRLVCGMPIFSFGDYNSHYSDVDFDYKPTKSIDYGGFAQDKHNQHQDYIKIAGDMGRAWGKAKAKELINE